LSTTENGRGTTTATTTLGRGTSTSTQRDATTTTTVTDRAVQNYVLVEGGTICSDYSLCVIDGVSECEIAALDIGLSDTSAQTIVKTNKVYGCWYRSPKELLKFNSESSSTSTGDSEDALICMECDSRRELMEDDEQTETEVVRQMHSMIMSDNVVSEQFKLELESVSFTSLLIDTLTIGNSSFTTTTEPNSTDAVSIINIKGSVADNVVFQGLSSVNKPLQVVLEAVDVTSNVTITDITTTSDVGSYNVNNAISLNNVSAVGDITITNVDFGSNGGIYDIRSVQTNGTLSAEGIVGTSGITFGDCRAGNFAVAPAGVSNTRSNPASINGDMKIYNIEIDDDQFEVIMDSTLVGGDFLVEAITSVSWTS
jgi:hypothetical protein